VASAVPPMTAHVRRKVLACDSVTEVVDPDAIVPTPPSIVQVGAGVGASEKVHVHVTSVGTFTPSTVGDAPKLAMTGGTTAAMVVCATSEPTVLPQVNVNSASVARLTLLTAPFATGPTPGSMVHVGAGTGAFEYVQVKVTFVGVPIATDDGLATNAASAGATVTGRVSSTASSPAALPHVSLNTVSAARLTLVTAPLATGPTPWSMLHAGAGVGAFAYFQVKVTSVGVSIVTYDGLAPKAASTGATVTGRVSSTVSVPSSFVQVSV